MKSRAWDVRSRQKLPPYYVYHTDTVWFDADITARDVLKSLIQHDFYPDDIEITYQGVTFVTGGIISAEMRVHDECDLDDIEEKEGW